MKFLLTSHFSLFSVPQCFKILGNTEARKNREEGFFTEKKLVKENLILTSGNGDPHSSLIYPFPVALTTVAQGVECI